MANCSMHRGKTGWLIYALCILFALTGSVQCKHRPSFTGKDKSLAIIPFINADSIHGNEYLSEGMTSEITQRLAAIHGLHIVPASQVRTINYNHLTPVQTGRLLKAAAVIQGKIKRTGDQLAIHVEMTDINTGDQIWSKDFESNVHELFSFQNELAQTISQELNNEITSDNIAQLKTRPTQNLEAYDQYLKGLYFWNKRDAASLRKGITYFDEAIKLDSNYALAWCGLSNCYSALGYGSHDAPSTDFLKAETTAKKALALDSLLAEPYTCLGYIDFYYYWNWEKAEKEFRTAIRLNPDYPLAHDAYAYFLTARERFAEAGVEMEKAFTLDPSSAFIQTDRGFLLFYTGDYGRAISVLKDVLVSYPKFPLAWIWLGRSYQETKEFSLASLAYENALNKDSLWPVALAASGFIYGITGQRLKAEKSAGMLIDLMKRRYVTPYAIALVYTGLKDKNETFEWLNQAYLQRTNWLVWLKQDPRWAYIKNDSRYRQLVNKIGLYRNLTPDKRN